MDIITRDSTRYLTMREGGTVLVCDLSKDELEQEVCYLIDVLEKYEELTEPLSELSNIWRKGKLLPSEVV